MSNPFKFISGGGWVMRSMPVKVMTHRLLLSAMVSFGLSLFALSAFLVLQLYFGFPMPSGDLLSFLSYLLILPPPALIVLAIIFCIFERPREIEVQTPNPNYDPHNLY